MPDAKLMTSLPEMNGPGRRSHCEDCDVAWTWRDAVDRLCWICGLEPRPRPEYKIRASLGGALR